MHDQIDRASDDEVGSQSPNVTSTEKSTKEKLPPLIMVACCWPILLVAVGGLVGGLLGGLACGVNMALYRSSLPRWSLWLLNPLVGIIAVILYLVAAIALQIALAE